MIVTIGNKAPFNGARYAGFGSLDSISGDVDRWKFATKAYLNRWNYALPERVWQNVVAKHYNTTESIANQMNDNPHNNDVVAIGPDGSYAPGPPPPKKWTDIPGPPPPPPITPPSGGPAGPRLDLSGDSSSPQSTTKPLPKWVVPAALGVGGLILVAVFFPFGKKGKA